jgi:hypothetical protein
MTPSISATVPELKKVKKNWSFTIMMFILGLGMFVFVGRHMNTSVWYVQALMFIGAALLTLIGAAPIQRKHDGSMIDRIYNAHMVGVAGMFFLLAGVSVELWTLSPILVTLVAAGITYIWKSWRFYFSWIMECVIAAVLLFHLIFVL